MTTFGSEPRPGGGGGFDGVAGGAFDGDATRIDPDCGAEDGSGGGAERTDCDGGGPERNWDEGGPLCAAAPFVLSRG